jgi:dephospho-CoA kinase
VQVARVTKRSGLAPQEVEAIIRAQASREQRLQAADDVIDNGGDESRLDPQVQPLHQQYLVLGQAWARQASGE